MFHDFTYSGVLAAAQRPAWTIEDVIPDGAALDFARPFLPESFARTGELAGLSADERLLLNHIRGHEYLRMFGLIEETVLPFVLDHARPQLGGEDNRVRALLQFASEEAKHIHLFRRFHDVFVAGFGAECPMIGPGDAMAAEILRHDPLAVALAILHIEWMTQRHYVESVRADDRLDPLFKSLLRHHWIEEAQHAKLDTLMVQALAASHHAACIDKAIDEYVEIVAFLDEGLKAQAALNLTAFEQGAGRILADSARADFLDRQHQALRWTYIGSGMEHPNFRATLATLSPTARGRIDALADFYS